MPMPLFIISTMKTKHLYPKWTKRDWFERSIGESSLSCGAYMLYAEILTRWICLQIIFYRCIYNLQYLDKTLSAPKNYPAF